MYDFAVIGAGVVGCSVARMLSKYKLRTILIDKESDVANCTTKANSAIVHAGYDSKPGTLKAKLCVAGNAAFDDLCKKLDVPFRRTGSMVLAFNDEEILVLQKLYSQGLINGVAGLRILRKDEIRVFEPNISESAISALYAPSCGIVGPWELSIALAENAADNGVEIRLNTLVKKIQKRNNRFNLETNNDNVEADYVINCAGLNADEINNMITAPSFKILPRRGEYHVFDKNAGRLVNSVIFQCPSDNGKGVLVTPTVHGNLLIGPNSEEVNDKDNFETTKDGLRFVLDTAAYSLKEIPIRSIITSFAGLRAKADKDDFIIKEAVDKTGFINVAGIESPGLTAAPAIADYVENMLKQMGVRFISKEDFISCRRKAVRFNELSKSERQVLIDRDAQFGRVICRCETITEGEIVDVIKRNAGARTLDAVKRRARPGSGRCQGGFCCPRVIEILARELKIEATKVVKDSPDSYILINRCTTDDFDKQQNVVWEYGVN